MQHYRAPDNSLHAIDAAFVHMLPTGCVAITEEEAEALRPKPPQPNPKVERLAEIDQEAQLTPRAFRELVILMTEGFKAATAGALDLTTVPGVAQVYTLETEAQALRSELGLFTAPE